jgi:hypothetical protein
VCPLWAQCKGLVVEEVEEAQQLSAVVRGPVAAARRIWTRCRGAATWALVALRGARLLDWPKLLVVIRPGDACRYVHTRSHTASPRTPPPPSLDALGNPRSCFCLRSLPPERRAFLLLSSMHDSSTPCTSRRAHARTHARTPSQRGRGGRGM